MRTENLFIAGLGTWVPGFEPVAEAVREGRYDGERARAEGWTGVAFAGDVSAPELAAGAGVEALKRSGLDADRISLVLHAGTFHQGPDGWYAANYVQDKVVGTAVPAIGLDQGCTAMLDALHLAHGHLAVGPGGGAVLVTAADNFGAPLVDRWKYADGWTAGRGSVLGDAGCAAVVSTEGGPLRIRSLALSSLSRWEHLYRGEDPVFPPRPGLTVETSLGRRMAAHADRLDRDGGHDAEGGARRAVAGDLVRARTALARQAMEEAGIGPADVTRVTHVFSGHPRYLETLLEPLGIDPGRGMLDLGRAHGHLGAGDQFLSLAHLVETGAVSPGDHVLMMGNGAGISLACSVIEVLEDPGW
ncbi:ketoacyl-ACP synthase III family protein [Kitasatospora sp. NPDC058406]|uniref:ketoacyl-ACP synthase III family protein n=1 Tax=Kitasatospora sp. NPDC058406 TaxID=3346483 RepID=UPI0036494815